MPRPPLDARRIDIWHVSPGAIADPAKIDAFRSILSPDELERLDRFTHDGSRRLFLAARGTLREVLSRYTGVGPGELAFRYGVHGKPSLASPSDSPLEFSLSRAPGLAICAVASVPVGVDVERERTITGALETARGFFAAAETAELAKLPAARRSAVFLDYWTLRESLSKARGLGLAADRSAFAFTLRGEDEATVSFGESSGENAADWRFYRFRPAAGYRAAVAFAIGASQKATIKIRRLFF